MNCKKPNIKLGDKLKLHIPMLGIFETKVIGFDDMNWPGWPGCKWPVFPLPPDFNKNKPYHVACCSPRILENLK